MITVPALVLISYVGSFFFLLASLLYLYYLYVKGRHVTSFKSKRDTALEEAQASAHKIIQDAIDRAREILVDTKYMREDFLKKLEDQVQSVADHAVSLLTQQGAKFETEYTEVFEKIKQEFMETAHQNITSIQKTAEKEIEDFRATLQRETVAASEFVGKRITAEFDEASREIETYRQKRLKEVDERVHTLVLRIAEDVLGHALSLPDQEKLVMDAIEHAEREGFFRK